MYFIKSVGIFQISLLHLEPASNNAVVKNSIYSGEYVVKIVASTNFLTPHFFF